MSHLKWLLHKGSDCRRVSEAEFAAWVLERVKTDDVSDGEMEELYKTLKASNKYTFDPDYSEGVLRMVFGCKVLLTLCKKGRV